MMLFTLKISPQKTLIFWLKFLLLPQILYSNTAFPSRDFPTDSTRKKIDIIHIRTGELLESVSKNDLIKIWVESNYGRKKLTGKISTFYPNKILLDNQEISLSSIKAMKVVLLSWPEDKLVIIGSTLLAIVGGLILALLFVFFGSFFDFLRSGKTNKDTLRIGKGLGILAIFSLSFLSFKPSPKYSSKKNRFLIR